jgi:hypothetical protein
MSIVIHTLSRKTTLEHVTQLVLLRNIQ